MDTGEDLCRSGGRAGPHHDKIPLRILAMTADLTTKLDNGEWALFQ
jgi:hypothetical protein